MTKKLLTLILYIQNTKLPSLDFDAVLVTHFDCKPETPLDRKTWSSIKTKFEPHEEWHSRNPDIRLDHLDADTIEAL